MEHDKTKHTTSESNTIGTFFVWVGVGGVFKIKKNQPHTLETVFAGQQVPGSFSVGSPLLQSSGADFFHLLSKFLVLVSKFLQGNKRALNFISRLGEGYWRTHE